MSLPLMSGVLGGRKRSIALAIVALAVVALIWFAFFRQSEPVKAPIPALAVPEGQAGKAGEVVVTQEAMKLAEINVEPVSGRSSPERRTWSSG